MSTSPISSISPVDGAKNDLIEEDNRRRHLAKLASIDRIATVQKEADATDALLHGLDQAAAAVADRLNTDVVTAIAARDTGSNLARLNELARQAASDTLSDAERQNIQIETDAIRAEIDQATATAVSNRASAAVAAASEEAIAQQTTNQQAIDLLAVTSGAQNLDAADQASTRSHDLILDHVDTSVSAQANQNSAAALKLLDNG
ncbi:MAG: hypothetical protein QOI66_1296 [Myxococcales bacterium]|jgi:flagellin|nr:hypothetical protein [Myxococcales bacterium]